MCNLLEIQVLFGFLATAPQLDSLTQWVNEFALRKTTFHSDFIEDFPFVAFATADFRFRVLNNSNETDQSGMMELKLPIPRDQLSVPATFIVSQLAFVCSRVIFCENLLDFGYDYQSNRSH